MKALTRKLLRDVGKMSGAVLTISLVVGAGIAAFVTLRGTWLSIIEARDRYYSAERFADVFSALERAPLSLAARIEELPGVERVYPRVVGAARVPLPDLRQPAEAHVVSLPEEGMAPLCGVRLTSGRMPAPERDDEALLLEIFAEKHGLLPGDSLTVVMEGRERKIRVVGTAMSPEYVLAVPNGASAPAPERFAVLWMVRPAVEAAYDMSGAFNNVLVGLAPNASPEAIKSQLDVILDPYGGLGAYAREHQISNYYLDQDLTQLKTLATIAPAIFLGVAAFLLNVVLSRLIELDRPQIATLKAIGYSDREVGLHYLELTLLIALIGGMLGLSAGAYLGRGMTGLYTAFYRIPGLGYHMDGSLIGNAVLVSLGAGLLGAVWAVRKAVLLPPAEAMRPAAPPNYRRTLALGRMTHYLSSTGRMVMRELLRRPARTALSAIGIGAATGILVVGQFFSDAMGYLIDFYLQVQQRETLSVTFVNPVPEATVHAFSALPGVRDVQFQSTLQVRVRAGHRERIVPMVGHAPRPSLRPLLDDRAREVSISPGDVLFTDTLAKVLHVRPGDTVVIEPMQGERTPHTLTLTGTVPELMGLWIHMPLRSMQTLLREAPNVSEALLVVDSDKVDAVQDEINDMPQVANVLRKSLLISEFRKQTGETMGTFSFVLTAFAMIIAVSVVYNNARVALSLRSRELASLRVLGFTRREISAILINELFAQVLLGIPIGLYFGKQLVALMMGANDPEAFRFPTLISGHTYAFAALVTLLAALASALLVRRKLDHLDLIEVLKTRE